MTFLRRRNAIVAMAALGAATLTGSALAQQTVTLRLHQFLPPTATIPARAIVPWAKKSRPNRVAASRSSCSTPCPGWLAPQLFDQARDGVVDIT